MNSIRQVMAQKGVSPEDLMSNALFQARWSDVLKLRGDELACQRSLTGQQPHLEDTDMVETIDVTLRGSKGLDRCAPDSTEYWDSFAAQLVRQYVRLCPEPASATGIANEVKNSALNREFVGECNKSTVAIIMDTELLQESSNRPGDRKPPPNQLVISKLLGGVMMARDGATNEEGLRIAPRDDDIFFLCDGGRDSCKSAVSCTQSLIFTFCL
jgi:hypothetical protein